MNDDYYTFSNITQAFLLTEIGKLGFDKIKIVKSENFFLKKFNIWTGEYINNDYKCKRYNGKSQILLLLLEYKRRHKAEPTTTLYIYKCGYNYDISTCEKELFIKGVIV